MKVMLLFPPHWTPAMPHLALPTLASFLRARGIEVIQRDLNVEVFDQILSRPYLERAVLQLRDEYGLDGRRRAGAARPAPARNVVQRALARGPEVAAAGEEAAGVIRSEGFLEGPPGLQALLTVTEALALASLPFFPASLELATYKPAYPADSSRSLLEAARDPQVNLFVDIFRRGIIPDIEREQPDLVGISVATLEQMPAAMTLACLTKEAGLPCHVAVGGPHITMLREQFLKVPALFDFFDTAVIFDGEEALLRLVEALDGDGNLAEVPNLLYRDGGRVRATAQRPLQGLADLPRPDFDGLPLDRYLVPQRVLPLASSRGCYHGRCGFCNVGYGGPATYRRLAPERVVEQMLALKERYGARHIFFTDEALAPRTLRGMSRLLQEAGSPVEWCGCVRFETALTGELLERMAGAGCRMLLFGLETASEPIMARMRKGTQLEEMGRILQQGARAGIWNHVFFFFGFPGETMDHAQDTVNFVYAQQQAIHSASAGTFALERYAPVYRDPQRYGVTRIVEEPGKDLAICFDYQVETGLGAEMAERVASRLLDVLPGKRYGHFYVHQAYQFLYAGHLRAHGQPLPLWLAPEEATAA